MPIFFTLLLLAVSFPVFSQEKSTADVIADIPNLNLQLRKPSQEYKKCPKTIVLSKYSSKGSDLEYFNYATPIFIKLLQDKLKEKDNFGLVAYDSIIRLSFLIDIDGKLTSIDVNDVNPLQDLNRIEQQFNEISYQFENSNPKENCIQYRIILTVNYSKY